MNCDGCGGESKRYVYHEGKRLCGSCRPALNPRWPGLHEVGLNKKRVRLTRAQVGRIDTNTEQPDGTYESAKRFRSNDGWGG
mgnify:CR=1 FL=1